MKKIILVKRENDKKKHIIKVPRTSLGSRTGRNIEYIINENGCHICISHKPNGNGYPRINYYGKRILMNRYIFMKFSGNLESNLCVRHTCDNPICINPKHLLKGTKKENSQDMKRRGRSTFGERQGNHKLKEMQVIEIRRDYENGIIPHDIAKKYNISYQTIIDITRYRSWAYLKNNGLKYEKNNIM